jgi:hypothetical protein
MLQITPRKRWSNDDEHLLVKLVSNHGHQWNLIASMMQRSEASVKLHFYRNIAVRQDVKPEEAVEERPATTTERLSWTWVQISPSSYSRSRPTTVKQSQQQQQPQQQEQAMLPHPAETARATMSDDDGATEEGEPNKISNESHVQPLQEEHLDDFARVETLESQPQQQQQAMLPRPVETAATMSDDYDATEEGEPNEIDSNACDSNAYDSNDSNDSDDACMDPNGWLRGG